MFGVIRWCCGVVSGWAEFVCAEFVKSNVVGLACCCECLVYMVW